MPSRTFLPLMTLAIYFVGAAEFMLSSLLTPLAQAFDTTTDRAVWLIAVYALSYAVAAPVFGYFSDRMQRRRLLLSALLLFVLDNLALAFAPSFDWALLLRLIGGLTSAALVPAIFSLIADVFPAERHSTTMGYVMLGMTSGIATGPALAGFLTEMIGWQAPFLLIAGGCLLAYGLGVCAIPNGATFKRRQKTVFRSWFRSSCLIHLLIAKGLWNGAAVVVFLLTGEMLRLRYALGSAMTGGMLAAFGIGLAIGNLTVGRVKHFCGGDAATLVLAILLLTLSLGIFLFWTMPLWSIPFCLGSWGVALGVAAPSSTALLAQKAAQDKGMVLAVSESLNNVSIMSMLPVTTALMTQASIPSTLFIILPAMLAGLFLTLCGTRRYDIRSTA